MSTGWNTSMCIHPKNPIINLLGNEYWLELQRGGGYDSRDYKPTGK